MVVALDINGVYTTRAGIARHLRGLMKGFAELQPPDLKLETIAWPVENFEYSQPQRALKTLYREFIWPKLSAPRLLRKLAPDLVHGTANPLVLPPARSRFVFTLPDLAVLRHPERFRSWQLKSARRGLRRGISADRIICISQFTADEAAKLLEVPREKMEVIHCGCDFQEPGTAQRAVKPAFALPPEFFLFVGSLEPGKNLALLRQVYELAGTGKASLPPLLIVGARWEGVPGEGNPPANWHYLGQQPDEVLIYLYAQALALVFPSKYEGFGLPIAEAMSLGCPVICSKVASLPEVGGNAAFYSELTPQAYLKAMRELFENARLREELRAMGLIQAAKFTWKNNAQLTMEVYRSVVSGGAKSKKARSFGHR